MVITEEKINTGGKLLLKGSSRQSIKVVKQNSWLKSASWCVIHETFYNCRH